MSDLSNLTEQQRNRYDYLQNEILESDSKADHYETAYALWMARVEALEIGLDETLQRIKDDEIRLSGEQIRALRFDIREAKQKASEAADFAQNFRTRITDLRTSAQWVIDMSTTGKPANETALLRRQVERLSNQLQALQES